MTTRLILVESVRVEATVMVWLGLLLERLVISDLDRIDIADIGLIIRCGDDLNRVHVTKVSGTEHNLMSIGMFVTVVQFRDRGTVRVVIISLVKRLGFRQWTGQAPT